MHTTGHGTVVTRLSQFHVMLTHGHAINMEWRITPHRNHFRLSVRGMMFGQAIRKDIPVKYDWIGQRLMNLEISEIFKGVDAMKG